jgi:hypothetical protein
MRDKRFDGRYSSIFRVQQREEKTKKAATHVGDFMNRAIYGLA